MEYEELERVSSSASCKCCDPHDCQDMVSLEQIIFPAYRNMVSGTCWSRSTVSNIIMTSINPRDPITGRLWTLPPPIWDIHEIISLKNEGMIDAARSLFKRTLIYAITWSVYDVVALYESGLTTEAEQLRGKTMKYSRWNIYDLFILNNSGLHDTAWRLCRETLQHAQDWSVDDIISLQNAGMKCEARSLLNRTLINAQWNVQDIVKLHIYGPTRSASQLFATTLKHALLSSIDSDIGKLQAAGLYTNACQLLKKHKSKSKLSRNKVFPKA